MSVDFRDLLSRLVEAEYPVFEADPCNEGERKGEVEQPFVGYREDDEGWCEREKDDGQTVEVMVVWL